MDRRKLRLLKISTQLFPSAFSGVFNVDDRRKRIKKCAFSNEYELVCRIGENKTKTLLWWKLFCFVFVGKRISVVGTWKLERCLTRCRISIVFAVVESE